MKNVVLYFLLFAILILLPFNGSSQIIRVKGLVTADIEAAASGSATVFSKPDSSLVKGTYLDSNRFELYFKKKESSDYYLRITIPGYSDTIINFMLNDSLIDLGMIRPIKNTELSSVEVVYVKEMYKRTLDGITVNVEGTNLQTLTNLFEVLKSSPKITSPDEESIEIIGRGRPLILVDRQAIISNEELRAIPANQIEKIDIITNPSAKYKAQGSGNGVIEVFTKNFHLEGYNFTIRGSGGLSTQLKPSASGNLGLSLKKEKFSLNGYFGGNYNSSIGYANTTGVATDNSGRSLTLSDNYESSHTWQYYNIKAAYNLNAKKKISFGVNGYGSNGGNSNTAETVFYHGTLATIASLSNSTSDWTWLNNSGFINYTVETDTNKSNFELNLNYTNKVSGQDRFAISEFSDLVNNTTSNFSVRNDARDVPNIGELRVNYEHVFDTTGWKLGVGLSYSLLVNGKKLDRFSGQENNWLIDVEQSNSYDYTENIGAAFLEVTKNWEKLSGRVGLRTEYTNLNGFSNSLNKEFIDSTYVLPFLSASAMWQTNENVAITLFYDSGIDRPQFDNYDPFIVQSDSFSINYGNPYLLPGIEQSIGLEFDLFYKYNLSVSYDYVKDPISSISFIKPNSFLTETTPWNAKYEQGVSASFSVPIQTKWLQGWNSIWASYTQYTFTADFNREPFNNLTFGLYSNLTFKLPKQFEVSNRFHINKWGTSTMENNVVVYWSVRGTKRFKGNKYHLFVDVSNIVPPKYNQRRISGNYEYTSISQNQFTTFQLGFYAKIGRLREVSQIKESKSGQSDRL